MTLEDLVAGFVAPFEAPGGQPILTAYQDVAGVWTIGYGTTYYEGGDGERCVTEGLAWTPEQCLTALTADIGETVSGVVAANVWHPWSDDQIIALTSLCYNIGMTAFRTSSVLRLHNQGRAQFAASAFLLWDRAHVDGQLVEVPGLLARRNAEAAKYLTQEQTS